MTALNQILGEHLGRLHVIRPDAVSIVQIAGARGKHERNALLCSARLQLAANPRASGDDDAVHPLCQQGVKALEELLAAVATVQEKHHPSLGFKRLRQPCREFGIKR